MFGPGNRCISSPGDFGRFLALALLSFASLFARSGEKAFRGAQPESQATETRLRRDLPLQERETPGRPDCGEVS